MGRKNYLSTPVKARKYLNKVLHELEACDPAASMSWYRARTYVVRQILEALQLEKAVEIEVRLERIEQLLAGYREEIRA